MPLADLLGQLDARPGVRGRQFERVCAWFMRNAPEYRERIRRVWLWSEWSGAWAADAGIDLVAEERDGRLWAIQAKAYDPSYSIRKADVDSFLSESSRPQFSYRLLIATTDRLGLIARRTLASQREPVGYLLRSQLELAHVAWPRSLDDLRPRRLQPKQPLPHVREAIEATVRGLADQERGRLIMACGTGKTLAAMWIAERLGSTRTLVLVPSLSLLAQTLREWAANASQPFEYLAVCSDQTVVGTDEFVQDIAELGFPVTTDPGVIAGFLRCRGRRVVFSTYQSSPQIVAAYRGKAPQFDLAIADEAHRCAGRTSSEFATILDARKIRTRRRLFMTATPRFYTPRLRRDAGVLDVEVASMDDESVFGAELHRLTFGEAIERKLLSDYEVVVVGVDNEMYRAWAERGEFVTPDGEKVTDARTLAGQIAVAKAMRKYNLRRVISFHSRVSAARKFSEDVPFVIAWMPARARPRRAIWSEHVSGAMSSGHRDRVLLRFRDLAPDEIGLLSNARCLGEGVDVPSLDGVAFIDPRRSTTDIIQAVGRAIRKAPDKTHGTIVVPVFLSEGDDPDRVLDESAFQYVWDVLKALRAHDEALGEELDELRRRLGARRPASRRPGKIKLDLPRRVGADFARAFDVLVVEQTTAAWEFWFGLLKRYAERPDARMPPPVDYREDGQALGDWVRHQRAAYRRGALAEVRADRLADLPRWTWDARPLDAWDAGLQHFVRFAERYGHGRVVQSYIDEEDNYSTGKWVATQRLNRAKMPLQRRRRLDSTPHWMWARPEWDEGFDRLVVYLREHGHSHLRVHEKDRTGFRLGRWISRQRSYYKLGNLKALPAHRISRLDGLEGWRWDWRPALQDAKRLAA
jgi:predicted helicase